MPNYLTPDIHDPLQPNATVSIAGLTACGLFGKAYVSTLSALGCTLLPAGLAAAALPLTTVVASCALGGGIMLIPHIILNQFIDASVTSTDLLKIALYAASLVTSIVIGGLILSALANPVIGGVGLLASLVVHGLIYGGVCTAAAVIAVAVINSAAIGLSNLVMQCVPNFASDEHHNLEHSSGNTPR